MVKLFWMIWALYSYTHTRPIFVQLSLPLAIYIVMFAFWCALLAKAPCVSAVEAARDIVGDLGVEVASRSGGLVPLASCSLSNSERDCRRVLVDQFSLALPVKKSQLGELDYIPVLKIRDWFSFFLSNSCLHILVGLENHHPTRQESILTTFWDKFQKLRPTHEIFARASEGVLVLKRTIPLLVHGDEGRGRRHVAHFVLSFHSCLGFGFAKKKRSEDWNKMECNFSGHSYTNRFLICSLRKKDYTNDNSSVWQLLLDEIAVEASFMAEHGVTGPDGLQYFGVVVGVVGDWPFLHKSGGFCRSFNNIQKRKTIKNDPLGICHLCLAGQVGHPIEQLETTRPSWRSTLHAVSPFLQPNPLATGLMHEHGKEAGLWSYDWFHTLHLGVMKHYLGSVLALFSLEEPQGNVDDRFHSLSERYKLWCSRNSRRPFLSKLTKETIQWETTLKFPVGSWHKGSLSTTLMEFCEHRFKHENFSHEPLLSLAGEACIAIQRCHRILYRSCVWLSPETCRLVSQLGCLFLRRYSQLATLAYRRNQALFVFQPKIHILQHFMLDLLDAANANLEGFNPLVFSCQQSEDFIGRPSRLSRRVTAQRPVLHRVADRYLMSAYHHFIGLGCSTHETFHCKV